MAETGYACPECGSYRTHWIDRDEIECETCDHVWEPDEDDCEYTCPRCGSSSLEIDGDDCECLDCGLVGETSEFED